MQHPQSKHCTEICLSFLSLVLLQGHRISAIDPFPPSEPLDLLYCLPPSAPRLQSRSVSSELVSGKVSEDSEGPSGAGDLDGCREQVWGWFIAPQAHVPPHSPDPGVLVFSVCWGGLIVEERGWVRQISWPEVVFSKLKTKTSVLKSPCRNKRENIWIWPQGEYFGKGGEKR